MSKTELIHELNLLSLTVQPQHRLIVQASIDILENRFNYPHPFEPAMVSEAVNDYLQDLRDLIEIDSSDPTRLEKYRVVFQMSKIFEEYLEQSAHIDNNVERKLNYAQLAQEMMTIEIGEILDATNDDVLKTTDVDNVFYFLVGEYHQSLTSEYSVNEWSHRHAPTTGSPQDWFDLLSLSEQLLTAQDLFYDDAEDIINRLVQNQGGNPNDINV